ncbi:hypothetical protein JCM10449v2_004118 [Rhodotorula kratochvilovae]
MSTSCGVVLGSSAVYTVVSTSTIYATAVSTAPASTVTTSTPVVTSNCVLPTALGELALCETTTSLVAVQTVLPGAVTTLTNSREELVTLTRTRQGVDRTVCSAVPASTPSSTAPAEPTPAPSSSSSPTEPRLGPSTSVTFATTTITSTPSSPSPSPDSLVRSISSLPSDSPSSNSLPTTDEIPPTNVRRTTSFVTSWVTIVDNSGRTVSSATSVPTLLNVPDSSSSSSNHAGAIAGGTIGGVAALVLAGVIFWLMRKRGYFRKGDEEIEEDVWNPAPHAGHYGGSLARRNGGGGGGAVTAAAGMSAGGRSSPDEKGDGVSDEDRLVDAATLERHQSWYNSLRGHRGELDPEDAYGGEMAQRAPSPPASDLGAGFAPLPPLAYAASPRSLASHGPQRSMSLSNRLSVHSHSSYSHEGALYPAALPHVPIPDHRLSQLSQYAHWHAYAPPAVPPLPADPAQYASRSPPTHSHSHPSFERARSTSPPILPLAPAPAAPNPALARQRSLPGLAIPPHLHSYGPRPPLEALQHVRASSSGGTPVRGRTDDSLSSGSGSGSSPLTPGSAGSSHAHSYSMPALTHADSDATLATTSPATTLSSSSHDPKAAAPAVPAHATLERLKRPPLGRADSAESFLAPSQWLGARVVNADDEHEEDGSTVASLAGRSGESLPGPHGVQVM